MDVSQITNQKFKLSISNFLKLFIKSYYNFFNFGASGTTEADVDNGKISDESPVGKALLGKKLGDEVTVEAPAGEFKVKILEISK